MPRANRYLLPGYTYHLTHRCHNGSFLFRFAKDRTEYCRRLRVSVRDFGVSLLAYCITSNHTHLLVTARDPAQVSSLMQKLEGEFAEHYNIRKRRKSAFWGGRYHSTMIAGGEHLWNCMRYIDLNMVRAGVVSHPSEWRWCGYNELTGARQRYRLLDMAELLELHDGCLQADFQENYRQAIAESIASAELEREAMWTESIAVGSEAFVREIEEKTRNRAKMELAETPQGTWTVRETRLAYS